MYHHAIKSFLFFSAKKQKKNQNKAAIKQYKNRQKKKLNSIAFFVCYNKIIKFHQIEFNVHVSDRTITASAYKILKKKITTLTFVVFCVFFFFFLMANKTKQLQMHHQLKLTTKMQQSSQNFGCSEFLHLIYLDFEKEQIHKNQKMNQQNFI